MLGIYYSSEIVGLRRYAWVIIIKGIVLSTKRLYRSLKVSLVMEMIFSAIFLSYLIWLVYHLFYLF